VMEMNKKMIRMALPDGGCDGGGASAALQLILRRIIMMVVMVR